MLSALRTVCYMIIFMILSSFGIKINTWQFWAIFILLIVQAVSIMQEYGKK